MSAHSAHSAHGARVCADDRYEREAAVSCDPYNDDYRHPNCRHDWNELHPDDPVTLEEQIQYSANITWWTS